MRFIPLAIVPPLTPPLLPLIMVYTLGIRGGDDRGVRGGVIGGWGGGGVIGGWGRGEDGQGVVREGGGCTTSDKMHTQRAHRLEGKGGSWRVPRDPTASDDYHAGRNTPDD